MLPTPERRIDERDPERDLTPWEPPGEVEHLKLQRDVPVLDERMIVHALYGRLAARHPFAWRVGLRIGRVMGEHRWEAVIGLDLTARVFRTGGKGSAHGDQAYSKIE